MEAKTQTQSQPRYFVGPDSKGSWANFETEEQVREWIAANAEWRICIGDSQMEEARYKARPIYIYERTIKHSGSGERMYGAWVLSQINHITSRRRS